MRLLILIVIVGVCLVSAKYLPDETGNYNQLLSRHKRSDSEDSLDESNSNDTDDTSEEEQSKLHAKIEKMRQKLLEKQEKEKRRQEEAQQKLEERIARELQKEEERRQKEEERRQKELQKEEERRHKELQREEERRQKEEEKRLQELQKYEEKLEKERKKLEEQQKKLREKALENERKQQEMLQKQLEEMEEETLKLQEGDDNSSDADTDESIELEDFWKSYIYTKYGLNESNTDLEKRIALRRYMQEELGLNVNSTESERRQAIMHSIESKWQAVSEQYALQTQMTDFVNRVGVQKIRAQLEKEIEELNNKTDTLTNVNLPWVPLARDNFAEQISFLQTIKEFLANIVPNWYNESISSTDSTGNTASGSIATISSVPSENQNQNVLESSSMSSESSTKDLPSFVSNMKNLNDLNASAFPKSSDDSWSTVAVDSSSNFVEPSSTIGSGKSLLKSSDTTMDTDKPSLSVETGIDKNIPVVSSTITNKVTGIAPDSASDLAHVDSKNKVNSNGFTSEPISVKGPITNDNSLITPLFSDLASSNLIDNESTSHSVILSNPPLPALASTTSEVSLSGVQDSDSSVNANTAGIHNHDPLLNPVQTTSDLTNSAASINNLFPDNPIIDDIFTSKNLNTIKNEDTSRISPITENASIKTDVTNNSLQTGSISDNFNGHAGKISGSSVDQATSVPIDTNKGLSNLVTQITSSIITTEASEIENTDLKKKPNTDNTQSSAIDASELNNNKILDSVSATDYSNRGNILLSTTENSGINIITSTNEGMGITNNLEKISTASNIESGTDGSIYSSVASTDDNGIIMTLPPALATESQNSAFSVSNDFTKLENSDIPTDASIKVVSEHSNKISVPNTGFVHPTVNIAVNDKDKENISTSLTNLTHEVIKSIADNVLPSEGLGNNEQNIITPVNTEQPKTTDNVAVGNLHLDNVHLTSEVDNQSFTKTLDASKYQHSNEPLTTISTIGLEEVTSTVTDSTFENHDIVSSSLTPGAVIAEQVDDAYKAPNALNSTIVSSKNSSSNSGDVITDNETMKDTQTTVLDQSTSIAGGAQQLEDNYVTENQHIANDATLADAGIPIMTESIPNEVEFLPTTSLPENGNNDAIKEQENTFDKITAPIENGASILSVGQY